MANPFTKQVVSLEYGWNYIDGKYVDARGNIRNEQQYLNYIQSRKRYDESWEDCTIDDVLDIVKKSECYVREKRSEFDAVSGLEKVFFRAIVFNYDSFTEVQYRDNFDGTTIARMRNLELEDLGYVLNRMEIPFNEKLEFVTCSLGLDLELERFYQGYHIVDFALNSTLYRLIYSREKETIRIKLVKKLVQQEKADSNAKVKKENEWKLKELMGL